MFYDMMNKLIKLPPKIITKNKKSLALVGILPLQQQGSDNLTVHIQDAHPNPK